MTARTKIRSIGRCQLCRKPIAGRQRITRVARMGWCHSDCAAARQRSPRTQEQP